MGRVKAFLFAALLLGAFLLSTIAPATSFGAGGGSFWLTDGSNGTGDARFFDILPERYVNFPGLLYNSNCGASCGPMDNTVSSVVFSCGVSGTPIDQTDWIKIFTELSGSGSWSLHDPNYPAACSNGRIIMNITINSPSSMQTNE